MFTRLLKQKRVKIENKHLFNQKRVFTFDKRKTYPKSNGLPDIYLVGNKNGFIIKCMIISGAEFLSTTDVYFLF